MAANLPPRLFVDSLSWQPAKAPRPIVDQVSLSVARGECVGLLGRNGSGKSSVLRAILGLVRARVRRMEWDGRPIALGDRGLRAHSGVVSQGESLDAKLTAYENLHMGGRLYALSPRAAAEAGERALEAAQLVARRDERVEKLSGGQRRRIELVRAEQHAPSLLLLDEPTQGLDAQAKAAFWQRRITAQQTSGESVLMATHDAQEAAHCHRIVVLDRGRVVADDAPSALLARVEHDVVTLEVAAGHSASALVKVLQEKLQLSARVEEAHQITIACKQAHAWIPKVVETVGAASLSALHMRKATLLDVLVTLVGDTADDLHPTRGQT